MRLIALLPLLLVAACSETPKAVNGFCELTVRKDFTDPGIRKQNRRNRQADDVNENTARRLKCAPLSAPAPVK